VKLGALSSPFTEDELNALYSTQVLTDPGCRLRVDLAVQCGLRAREIAEFIAGNIVDPARDNKSVYYVTIIDRKLNKEHTIVISKQLMQSLWSYRNSSEHQHRLVEWKLTGGRRKDAPLFLNRSGKCMSSLSVASVISIARKELVERGIVLKHSFQDLRQTFVINHIRFLSSKNLSTDSIQSNLAQLLGHSHSSTTQQYIKSSDSLTFDKQIDSRIFGEKD
jgi:integrase